MPARSKKKKGGARTPPAVALSLTLSGFEDGAPYTDRPLLSPDRWAMQAADSLTVRLGRGVELTLAQHPRALATERAGVGAVLWPGAVALAAALVAAAAAAGATAPPPRLLELGAGAVALPSLVAAALGGAATATDRPSVLPLLEANVAAAAPATGGRVVAAALDWNDPGAPAAAAALAAAGCGGGGAATLIAAADCVYEDAGDPGGSPVADAFVGVLVSAMTAAAAAAGGGGGGGGGCPAWVAVEPRSSAALEAFRAAAEARCGSVSRLPAPVVVGGGGQGGGGGGEGGWDLSHIHLYELRL